MSELPLYTHIFPLFQSTGKLRLPLIVIRQHVLLLRTPIRGIALVLGDRDVLRVLARGFLYILPKLSHVIAVINLEYMVLGKLSTMP